MGSKYKGTDPLEDARRIYKGIAEMQREDLVKTQVIKKLECEGIYDYLYERKINDPFNSFGFGIVAYFKILRMLIRVFIILSILMIPPMLIYYNGGEFEDHKGTSILSDSLKLGIGNLG